MPQIVVKRSSVPGKVPTTTDLSLGEIAVNTYDGKMFIKKNVSDAETIVTISASEYNWNYLVTVWTEPPFWVSTIAEGSVFNYTLNGITRFRLVPDPYGAAQDAFYTTFAGGVLSGLITTRG